MVAIAQGRLGKALGATSLELGDFNSWMLNGSRQQPGCLLASLPCTRRSYYRRCGVNSPGLE
jgi:hypothetical protein